MYGSNKSTQLQRLAKILKIQLQQVKLLYFQERENNKGADQPSHTFVQADLHLCCSHETKSGFLALRPKC